MLRRALPSASGWYLAVLVCLGTSALGCKESEGPIPPPRSLSSAGTSAGPTTPSQGSGAKEKLGPARARAMAPLKEETHISELVQLSFGTRAESPRFLPATLAKNGQGGIAFLDLSKGGCPSLVAVDLDGRPLEVPESIVSDFAVDAKGWFAGSGGATKSSCVRAGAARRLDPAFELIYLALPAAKRSLRESPGFQGFPDISPDGASLLYVGVTGVPADPEIWISSREGEGARRLTRAKGMDSRPRFSADGTRVYWSASRPQGQEDLEAWAAFSKDGSVPALVSEIWEMRADGSAARPRTRLLANSFAPISFGEGIMFTSNAHDAERRDFDLYYLGPGTRDEPFPTPTRLTFGAGFDGMASVLPDGRIAFVSDRGGEQAQLFTVTVKLNTAGD